MNIITRKTPGLLPLSDDFAGELVALEPSGLKRKQHPRLQIVRATGGNGCKANALGTGVFVTHLWAERPEGSGKLVPVTDKQDDDANYKTRRAHVLGIVSPALLGLVEDTGMEIPPGDPDDLCVMAAHAGYWAKADTVKEALQKCGLRGPGKASVAVVHRECWIDDFGGLHTPLMYIKEGRPAVQWINGQEGKPRVTLAQAEDMATELIAKARQF